MAQSAFHPATVLLPILMAHQTDRRAPLGQPSLVRAAVANRARRHVSQVPPVVPLGVSCMAQAAVRSWLMVQGVATGADLQVRRSPRLGVAGGAGETHLHMRLVRKAPYRRGYRFLGGLGVAKRAVRRGGVVEAMASSARLVLYRHGRSLMASVTTKSHGQMRIVEEAFPGKGNGVPRRGVMAEAASSR